MCFKRISPEEQLHLLCPDAWSEHLTGRLMLAAEDQPEHSETREQSTRLGEGTEQHSPHPAAGFS